jgi:hypothetical protein
MHQHARVGIDPFLLLLKAHGLPMPETEGLFAPDRKWRADYLWRKEKVIVEREGGLWRGGRRPGSGAGGHSMGAGIRRDMEKANAAQLLGYKYLRFEPRDLDSGAVIDRIRQALQCG